VQLGTLAFRLGLNYLLGVVPCTACISHEDSLIQAEYRDGDEIADKEEIVRAGESQGAEDIARKSYHTLLCILRANPLRPSCCR